MDGSRTSKFAKVFSLESFLLYGSVVIMIYNYSYSNVLCMLILGVYFDVVQYHQLRLIRLTSPNLNYLIGAGAILLYIDVYFYVVPTSDQHTATIFCNVCIVPIAWCILQSTRYLA